MITERLAPHLPSDRIAGEQNPASPGRESATPAAVGTIPFGPTGQDSSPSLLDGLAAPGVPRADSSYASPTQSFAIWKRAMVDDDIPGFLRSLHPHTLAWDAFQNPDTRDAAVRALSRLYGDAALGERLSQSSDTEVYELRTALPFDNVITFRKEARGWLIDLNQ